MVLTMVSSLLAVKGLLMYMMAPDSKPSARASPPPLAVRKMTGMSLERGSSLILRQTVKPSTSGIMTSSSTRSKLFSARRRSASAPPPAGVTSKPRCSRMVFSRFRMFSSSSTTRIRFAIKDLRGTDGGFEQMCTKDASTPGVASRPEPLRPRRTQAEHLQQGPGRPRRGPASPQLLPHLGQVLLHSQAPRGVPQQGERFLGQSLRPELPLDDLGGDPPPGDQVDHGVVGNLDEPPTQSGGEPRQPGDHDQRRPQQGGLDGGRPRGRHRGIAGPQQLVGR